MHVLFLLLKNNLLQSIISCYKCQSERLGSYNCTCCIYSLRLFIPKFPGVQTCSPELDPLTFCTCRVVVCSKPHLPALLSPLHGICGSGTTRRHDDPSYGVFYRNCGCQFRLYQATLNEPQSRLDICELQLGTGAKQQQQ